MRPITVTAGPYAAAAAAGLVASVTPTSGQSLTLLTNTVDAVQRRILVTFGNELSARTLKLTGTNQAGNQISETVAIASGGGSTAISVLDYLTLTSAVAGGGAWSAAMTVGTTATTTSGSSPWCRADDYGLGPTEISCEVTGTVNYTVEYSDDDPNLVAPQVPVAPASMVWFPDGTIAAQTGNKQTTLTATPMWARVTANSYTGGGKALMNYRQTGGQIGA